ncbi:MAG: translation initiation factor IF-2 [Polyangiaceae bacterium]|nr:translation initiation factor IF-2 [Polyangiaceae bacterium]
MSKVRVYEVAKQLNLDPKAVVGLFQSIGVTDVRNHMSSVDVDAVERLKKNLEKKQTHDVVEERIRRGAGTVLKRRAVAKPAAEPSSPSVAPASAPSSPQLEEAASREVAQHAVESALPTEVVMDRESAQALPVREAPEEHRGANEAAPSSVERASEAGEHERIHAEESAPSVPPAPPSAAESVAPPPAPSVHEVAAEAPAPPSVHELPQTRSEVHEVAAAVPPAPPSEDKPVAPPPAPSVHEVAAAAPAPPPAQVEIAPPVSAAPAPAEEPRVPSETPAPRSTATPKTGVEYWAGRPGVPMPTPINAPRTGIGGGAAGAMARRTEYNPRAGTAPQRSGGMRPGSGGPRGPGGMMQRGGPGGRGRPGFQQPRRGPVNVSTKEMSEHKKVIRIEGDITLSGMAAKMSLKATELLMKLLGMGMTGVHINTTLDADTAKILASEFGWEVEDVAVSEEGAIAAARGEDIKEVGGSADEDLEYRPPVVTVMGHVDHGKTSLLDKIRKSNVAGAEAGGITQHIGAYKVKTDNGTIVFLDTPGHEAFTAMRARGASATDIVVLVVAADDGVMPQTKEAISHAKAAKVPIIVAVNKIDKPSAEPERVKRELVDQGLQPEEWGGDTIFVNVSALTGQGIPQLLEMIGLQAEVLDLKANPKRAASGVVLEALLDRGRGPVARVLVQEGTLKVGDFVLAGPGFGKVRAMTNELGKQVHEAAPSTPVEILGLSDVPGAGDPLHAVKDAKKAQEIAESRKVKRDKSLVATDARISLEGLVERMQSADQQELRVIIKGDVQGSLEALASAFNKLTTERVKLSIIHAGVGAITEGDVNLAIASKAIIVGFAVRPAGKSAPLAEENKIEIRLYSIIYDAVDDVKRAMEGLLPTTKVEKTTGKAEIRAIFKIRGVVVAGCYVVQGKVVRGGQARLVREGTVIWDGKMAALKRFKDDVKEVAEGFECGISLDGFHDVKEKDIIESYEIEEVKQKL